MVWILVYHELFLPLFYCQKLIERRIMNRELYIKKIYIQYSIWYHTYTTWLFILGLWNGITKANMGSKVTDNRNDTPPRQMQAKGNWGLQHGRGGCRCPTEWWGSGYDGHRGSHTKQNSQCSLDNQLGLIREYMLKYNAIIRASCN